MLSPPAAAGRKKPSSKLPPVDTTVRRPEMAELAVMVSDAKHRALPMMATIMTSSSAVEGIGKIDDGRESNCVCTY